MGGIFFFFSQKLSLILFQKRKHYRNLVSKVPQKKKERKKRREFKKAFGKLRKFRYEQARCQSVNMLVPAFLGI